MAERRDGPVGMSGPHEGQGKCVERRVNRKPQTRFFEAEADSEVTFRLLGFARGRVLSCSSGLDRAARNRTP